MTIPTTTARPITAPSRDGRSHPEPVISVRALVKSYGSISAVGGIDPEDVYLSLTGPPKEHIR